MNTGGQCSLREIREENTGVLFIVHMAGHENSREGSNTFISFYCYHAFNGKYGESVRKKMST